MDVAHHTENYTTQRKSHNLDSSAAEIAAFFVLCVYVLTIGVVTGLLKLGKLLA